MHPIFKHRGRLLLYLGVWVVFGLLLTVVFVFGGNAPVDWSLEFAVPVAVVLGLQSLSFWYVVQAMPPDDTPVVRMVVDLGDRRTGVADRLDRHRLCLGDVAGAGRRGVSRVGDGHPAVADIRRRDRHVAGGAGSLSRRRVSALAQCRTPCAGVASAGA